MAKTKSRWLTKLFKKLMLFFIPKKISSKKGWLWFIFSRIITFFGSFFIIFTLLFSIFPVPYSSYMVQKKIENVLQGNDYQIKKEWVNLNNIAWQMQMAVIASEDQKFESHFGLDLKAIETALLHNSKSKQVRGGSTISQQTAKNMFLWHGQSWIRKGIEVPLTIILEKIWGKERILEVYLNIAEFGEGIFGVEAAAQHFFKKSAKNLTLQESALLAASLPNPIVYKVDKPGPSMRKRQAWIIRQVNALGGKNYLNKL
ncbi:monofunctional biosynthetic peptidoglycan transglycosylase [Mannheimia sp. AT1]|uniref:Biosynthetic peptidoglycan transglycosylase n=1 Tax=Mannheimia cairinae TaxID=3025936 RepID=A0ABT5MTY5_9PAST|nr:monofunctional biosynthetic peptidoglycan transglycosylase [Mannheimia cairinae]MDD0824931.1 monofunctional biosynthetic peptidoglycan transglycosylase [Mannheimia cairinae]MDD0826139.1 monofunctional biosynthetic peptidoglycan transglycosylase [Mannheimia cairinae]